MRRAADLTPPSAVRRPYQRRDPATKPRTVNQSPTRAERRGWRFSLIPPRGNALPATRGECRNGPRPCPLVRCKWHLYLDVLDNGKSIKLNHPTLEPWELGESCALDVAERGPQTLEAVAVVVNLTRERVRQIEDRAQRRMRQRHGAELR